MGNYAGVANPNRCKCGKAVHMRVIRMRGDVATVFHWIEHRDGTVVCDGPYECTESIPQASSYTERAYTILLAKWNNDNPKE